MNRNHLYALTFLLLGIGVAWFIIRDAAAPSPLANEGQVKSPVERDLGSISRLPENLGARKKSDDSPSDFFAIPNERIVQFRSEAAYRAALTRLGNSDYKILGKLDRFRALRLGGRDLSGLDDLLGEDATIASNYLVSLPLVPDPDIITTGVGFGSSALNFLNVPADNSSWGEGVTIAVIDTGVTAHIALPSDIRQITVDGINIDGGTHGHGTAVTSLIVSLPLVPDPDIITTGVGFGSSALNFLNVPADNSSWGEGVTIAVIDTGVTAHIALPSDIRQITVDGINIDGGTHGHGTAVTSLIVGEHSRIPGIAPSSTPVSIRVAGAEGDSNSFFLAEGILAAVNAGAQVINISMGSQGDSTIVREAVAFAQESGAVIVASAGNDGFSQISFPAAYDGVISVGAIDAVGSHLNFSNTSDNLSITAPGYEALAAWTDDAAISFTGTSASAPFVSGAIAAIISESDTFISGAQAADILLSYTNEAGAPGPDPFYGNGFLDAGRVIDRNTPGITDLAVASYNYEFDSANDDGLQISIENQGTETVNSSHLSVDVDGANFPITIPQLTQNERFVVTLPVGQTTIETTGALPVSGLLTYPTETTDAQPSNNQRSEILTLPTD